jgi:hypothetical protein
MFLIYVLPSWLESEFDIPQPKYLGKILENARFVSE